MGDGDGKDREAKEAEWRRSNESRDREERQMKCGGGQTKQSVGAGIDLSFDLPFICSAYSSCAEAVAAHKRNI